MKKIFIGLIVLGSLSAFSNDTVTKWYGYTSEDGHFHYKQVNAEILDMGAAVKLSNVHGFDYGDGPIDFNADMKTADAICKAFELNGAVKKTIKKAYCSKQWQSFNPADDGIWSGREECLTEIQCSKF